MRVYFLLSNYFVLYLILSQRKKNEKKARSRATRRCNSDETETTSALDMTNDGFEQYFLILFYFYIFYLGLSWEFIIHKASSHLIIMVALFAKLWPLQAVVVMVEGECRC